MSSWFKWQDHLKYSPVCIRIYCRDAPGNLKTPEFLRHSDLYLLIWGNLRLFALEGEKSKWTSKSKTRNSWLYGLFAEQKLYCLLTYRENRSNLTCGSQKSPVGIRKMKGKQLGVIFLKVFSVFCLLAYLHFLYFPWNCNFSDARSTDLIIHLRHKFDILGLHQRL